MGVYEKRREPTWRSSEGRFREQSPVREKEGRKHLTGYEPGWSERESERPRESARLGGSYGDVAVGVSRKKELTVAVSKRRSREGPAATQNEKRLKSNGSVKLNRDREDFRTNSGDKKHSALTYRETHQKGTRFMLEQFKEMMETRDQETVREQLPFLDQKSDRARLRLLQNRAEQMRAKDQHAPELASISREKQHVEQQLTEKKTQERRMKSALEHAREESKRMAGETEQYRAWEALYTVMDQPPPEEKPEDKSKDDLEEDGQQEPKNK